MLSRRSFVFTLCTQTKTQCRSKYEWVTPTGYDTGIKIYSELKKAKVPLIFPNPKYVKWYMCGPTVYDSSHIGHASSYVRCDVIRRILREYYNIDPVVAIGVTNVSEKIIQRAQELGQNPRELARKYEREFFSQMQALNVLPPSLILRVSDHTDVIKNFATELLKKGAAYKTIDGSIYFKTRVHKNYGRFKKPEASVDEEIVPGKFDHLDFALWKVKKSSKAKGIPGWHIQCSAMASHVFGNSLDIHSGGMDLVFPHHENEESQSTSFHNCEQWVNYWMHTGYNFDRNAMNLAIGMCEKVVRFLSVLDSYVKGTWLLGNVNEAELLQEMAKSNVLIEKNFSNDFSFCEALKVVLNLVKVATKMLNADSAGTTSRSPAVIASLRLHITKFFKSFGFSFAEDGIKNELPSALEALVGATVDFRLKVREKALFMDEQDKRKIMRLCDECRDNLQSTGIMMSDMSPSHTHWSVKPSKLNNGSTLKNVIDIFVWFRAEIRKLTPSLASDFKQQELVEMCRVSRMHLSTLGVIIEDFKDGRSYWSFPRTDYEATSKFETIINSTLKFYADIRKVASSLTENKSSANAKEEILRLCESAESNLHSFGIIVNDLDESSRDHLLEVNNSKGVSIVQNIMDMLMGSRDQVKSLAPLAKDTATSLKLENICFKTKKFLTCYGLKISDSNDRQKPTTWSIDETKSNKLLVKNLIDVVVMFIDDIKEAESFNDAGLNVLLLEICNSLRRGLKEIGVTLVLEGRKTKWSFKGCESVVGVKQQ